jgi:beta-glucosidase
LAECTEDDGTAGGRLASDFLWGAAISGHQAEGDNFHNDWWEFEKRFTPSGKAADFANRFEEDLDRAKSLGLNTFRFSLEWSRIEPRPGERNAAGIAYYEQLVEACRIRGLRPLITLVHFTLPRWARAGSPGGWLNPATHEAFEKHVRWVGEHFGGVVDLFVTLNEPNVLAGAGYLAGVFPPGKRFRLKLADRCQAELVKAHVLAYRALHEVAAARHPHQTIQVGVSPQVIAWRRSPWDLFGVASRFGKTFNWGFLDALQSRDIRFNLYKEKRPDVQGALDFVGLNYFMGMPATLLGILKFGNILRKDASATASDNGWPIDAQGFETLLLEAHRRYSKPILVTENGVADAQDSLRPEYLRSHIASLQRAAAAGADIRGYYHWSLIDNMEWHEGFMPRFGLFAVDYTTQARTARPSAGLYREIIAAGGVGAEINARQEAAHMELVLRRPSSAPRIMKRR